MDLIRRRTSFYGPLLVLILAQFSEVCSLRLWQALSSSSTSGLIVTTPLFDPKPSWNYTAAQGFPCQDDRFASVKVQGEESTFMDFRNWSFAISDDFPIVSIDVYVTGEGLGSGGELTGRYGFQVANNLYQLQQPQGNWIGVKSTFGYSFFGSYMNYSGVQITGNNISDISFGVGLSVFGAGTARVYCIGVNVTYETPAITSGYISTAAITSGDFTTGIESESQSSEENRNAVILGATIGSVGFVAALIAVIAIVRFRRPKAVQLSDMEMDMEAAKIRSQIQSRNQYGSVLLDADSTEYGVIPTEGFEKSQIINYKDLVMLKTIGAGAFGVVKKAQLHGALVAVKQLSTTGPLTEKVMGDFISELQVMLNLKPHPNVVGFIGMCTAPSLSLVIEFMEGGSLLDLILSPRELPHETLLNIARGIACGILHLHLENCTHRDIAARNVLLTSDLTAKISDFGLARIVQGDDQSKTVSTVGPLRWMSPESINHRTYSKKTDVWSYGITLIEIFSRQMPFANLVPLEVATKMSRFELQPEAPSDAPKVIQRLVEMCCRFEPIDRPDFSEIISIIDDMLAGSNK